MLQELHSVGVSTMPFTTGEQPQSPSMADVQKDDAAEFESWCPMTAVPLPTSFRLRAQEKSQRKTQCTTHSDMFPFLHT